MNKFKVYTYWCLSDNRMKMYTWCIKNCHTKPWIFTAVVFHNSVRLLLYLVPLPKTFSSTCWTNPILRRLLALGHVHLPHPSSCEVVKAWSKVVKVWCKVVNVWCKVVQVEQSGKCLVQSCTNLEQSGKSLEQSGKSFSAKLYKFGAKW